MKFDVILNHHDTREFNKIVYMNNQNCILGTPRGLDTNENISVLNKDKTYPSVEPGKVLYPVHVGDYISVQEKKDGTLYVNCYKVISITDTEVIGGPC